MKKKILLFLISMMFMPLVTFASNVYSGENLNECTKRYQSQSISINNDIEFSHCMEYSCKSGSTKYYSSNRVSCNNGNSDPYHEIRASGINNLSCTSSEKSKGEIKYYSIIMYYDCNRKSNGNSFTTTTKTTTKRTTKRVTTTRSTTSSQTTTITEAPRVVNTKLSSITLSDGEIDFKEDVFEYSVNVDVNIDFIDVKVVPIDANNKVEITGNTNVVNGSVIVIKVIGSDNSSTEYKINVIKEEKTVLSSNSKLKSLKVDGYDLNFNSKVNNYTLYIDEDVNELNIDYEAEDSKSTVLISGNNNLTEGSRVTVKVIAEDGTETDYSIDIKIKKKSNLLKILFIIILILSIVAGGYYIYKKVMNSKSGDKYEYE